MKDYLLSMSVLGLCLGFYSALVLTQAKPNPSIRMSSMSSKITNEKLSEALSESHPASPVLEARPQITR